MTAHVELRPGAYADSVSLMLASRAVAEQPGVEHALIAMATPLNLKLLTAAGYEPPAGAGPDDLLVAIRSRTPDGLADALASVDGHLRQTAPASAVGDQPAAGTVGAAARRPPTMTGGVALISVPGRHAFTEAVDALANGLHPMIFSDQVDVADEVALKDLGAAAGLLVMGPDCGTSIIGGVGLGFANVVRPGPVGIVAASGTGAQQVCGLLADAGIGISHVLGVGGRDLTAAVGGRSTLQALRLLDEDPATELIVLVSKPADPAVAGLVADAAEGARTPVVMGLIGDGHDLEMTAVAVAVTLGVTAPEPLRWTPDSPLSPRTGQLRGLFAGGTLRDEAATIARHVLGEIANDPAHDGHMLVDLGDDRYTEGRPHPMIDQSLRADLIAAEGERPGSHVLLLDVILGHAAHPDPARDLAAAISGARSVARSRGDDLAVVVSLIGTPDDPQGRDAQAEVLRSAAADVHSSNAEATRAALRLVEPSSDRPPKPTARQAEADEHTPPALDPPDVVTASRQAETAPNIVHAGSDGQGVQLRDLLDGEPHIVTAGVALFADALTHQGVAPRQIDWHPPAGDTAAALRQIALDPRRSAANADAVARLQAARPMWTDIATAANAIEGLSGRTLLHAGPPIEWADASGPLRGAIIGAVLYEGWADDPDSAERLAASGGVDLIPCHHRGVVGPMAGVVSPSMPVVVIHDDVHDQTTHATLNEGLGKVLRYGAYSPEVIERLRWMQAVLGPVLGQAIRARGPLDIRALVAQALQMGDECHNRNRAATSLLARQIGGDVADTGAASTDVSAVLRFIDGNDHFFLNFVMPACKAAADAARNIPGATMIVAMARNGTEFGIQTAGTGDRWFTGPAGVPDGLYLSGYGPEDVNPDIGDSTITETAGIGAFAMAAAPAIVRFVGGDVGQARRFTESMYDITLAEHSTYQIPSLGFRGTPVGIDPTLVVRTGIVPAVNTGMAGKVAGTGQVGAGLVEPPMDCFVQAVRALGATVPDPGGPTPDPVGGTA